MFLSKTPAFLLCSDCPSIHDIVKCFSFMIKRSGFYEGKIVYLILNTFFFDTQTIGKALVINFLGCSRNMYQSMECQSNNNSLTLKQIMITTESPTHTHTYKKCTFIGINNRSIQLYWVYQLVERYAQSHIDWTLFLCHSNTSKRIQYIFHEQNIWLKISMILKYFHDFKDFLLRFFDVT